MNKPPILRVCDDTVDVGTVLRDTLTQMNLTYAMLAAVVSACDVSNNTLPVLIAQAQAANDHMLSTLRHPTAGY